ncbi:MAG: DUF6069 family protein [Candidatus Dormibacterales bacterium]
MRPPRRVRAGCWRKSRSSLAREGGSDESEDHAQARRPQPPCDRYPKQEHELTRELVGNQGRDYLAEGGEPRHPWWARVTWATGLAVLVSVAGAVALFEAGLAAGTVDESVFLPSLIGMGPLSLASVALSAAVSTLAAGIVLGALAAKTRRPVRNFRIVATALAVITSLSPALYPGPPAAMRLTLVGLHAVVWAVSVGVLATLAGHPVRDPE